MKRLALVLALAALVTIVGVGCSSSKKDSDSSGGGGLTLTSSATPGGATRENSQLPLTVHLTSNRASALIYYTNGSNPADPSLTSSIYDDATPIQIDASYTDGTYIIDPHDITTTAENYGLQIVGYNVYYMSQSDDDDLSLKLT